MIPAAVEQTFNSLWNTGYFDDVRIERVDEPKCIQLLIYVHEKPTIRAINYTGLNAVSVSDVLDRFKKEKVGAHRREPVRPHQAQARRSRLKEMLGEHGHQFAIIRTEVKTIPPASVGLTFHIKEGPTVKVGKIAFDGNTALSSRELRVGDVNFSKPIGIPHSIFLENLFPRTFDASKLDEDAERVRQDYRDHGYYKANTGEPQTNVRNAGGINPFTLRPSKGKRIDILIPVEEGERYRLGGITFSGNKAFRTPALSAPSSRMKDGDWFNASLLQGPGGPAQGLRRPGLHQLRRHTPRPALRRRQDSCSIGTSIRRGQAVLRLAHRVHRQHAHPRQGHPPRAADGRGPGLQLAASRPLPPAPEPAQLLRHAEDRPGRRDPSELRHRHRRPALKLKEKGKNSIGLNGGISGLSGTFIGLNYETNNFLGLGETLSVNANIGDLARNLSFGFNEPYLRNKPISLGIQVFDSKTDYNPAKAYAITNGSEREPHQRAALAADQLQPVDRGPHHLDLDRAAQALPPHRRGSRRPHLRPLALGHHHLQRQHAQRLPVARLPCRHRRTEPAQRHHHLVVTPSFSFSTLDRAVGPHHGKDFNAAFQFAGVGGNIKYFAPTVAWRQFFPMKGLRISPEGRNVLGYRILFNSRHRLRRRGRSALRPHLRRRRERHARLRHPLRVALHLHPHTVDLNLTNPDGSLVPRDPTNPTLGTNVQVPLPVYRLASIGGDTNFTANLEYRIPIVSQVTFAFFTDFGMTFNSQPAQLRQSVARHLGAQRSALRLPAISSTATASAARR